jgi:hypothetical protein
VIIDLVNQQSQQSGGFLVILNEVPSTGTLEQHSLDALVGKQDSFGLLMFSLELITLELQRCMVTEDALCTTALRSAVTKAHLLDRGVRMIIAKVLPQ